MVVFVSADCQDPAELAVVDEEGGAFMGPLLRALNAVADDIRVDYPHVSVRTLAYQGTTKPPKTRPRSNVIIRYCITGQCDPRGPVWEWSEEPDTDTHQERLAGLKGWANLTHRVHLWEYMTSECPLFRST